MFPPRKRCGHELPIPLCTMCQIFDPFVEERKPRYGRWEGPRFGGRFIPLPEPDPGRNDGVFNLAPVVEGVDLAPVYDDAGNLLSRTPLVVPDLVEYEQRRELPGTFESKTVFGFGRPGGPINDPEYRMRGARNAERDELRRAREARAQAGNVFQATHPETWLDRLKRRFR